MAGASLRIAAKDENKEDPQNEKLKPGKMQTNELQFLYEDRNRILGTNVALL